MEVLPCLVIVTFGRVETSLVGVLFGPFPTLALPLGRLGLFPALPFLAQFRQERLNRGPVVA